ASSPSSPGRISRWVPRLTPERSPTCGTSGSSGSSRWSPPPPWCSAGAAPAAPPGASRHSCSSSWSPASCSGFTARPTPLSRGASTRRRPVHQSAPALERVGRPAPTGRLDQPGQRPLLSAGAPALRLPGGALRDGTGGEDPALPLAAGLRRPERLDLREAQSPAALLPAARGRAAPWLPLAALDAGEEGLRERRPSARQGRVTAGLA